jgi:hypothetical protein
MKNITKLTEKPVSLVGCDCFVAWDGTLRLRTMMRKEYILIERGEYDNKYRKNKAEN